MIGKKKGSWTGQTDKLNSDVVRTVSANLAESSGKNMSFRVLYQVKMIRPMYYHFSQSPEADYPEKDIGPLDRQLFVPVQILKEQTAVQ